MGNKISPGKGLLAAVRRTAKIRVTIALSSAVVVGFGAVVGVGAISGLTGATGGGLAVAEQGAFKAAKSSIGDDDKLEAIRSAATSSSTPWQILGAVYLKQKEDGGAKGPSIYKINESEAKELGFEIPENIDDEAVAHRTILEWLAQLTAEGEVGKSEYPSIYVGLKPKANPNLGLEPTGDKEDEKRREAMFDAWSKDLDKLPLDGMNEARGALVVEQASNWATGTGQCEADSSPDILSSNVQQVTDVKVDDLTPLQLGFAKTIIQVTADDGMNENAAKVALMTAYQESKFRMYWNSSVPGSRELAKAQDPNAPEGGFDLIAMGRRSKSLSVGLYQQQMFPSGYWGKVDSGMDAGKSTKRFLKELKTKKTKAGKRWDEITLGQAAQLVQVSAFPDHYAQWQTLAERLIAALPPSGGFTGTPSVDAEHDTEHQNTGTQPETQQTISVDVEEATSNPNNLKVRTDVKPDIQLIQKAIIKYFPNYISSMTGRTGVAASLHSSGLATDLMVKDYKSDESIKEGDKIAAFLIENRKQLGVQYIIWRDKIYIESKGGWGPYKDGGYGKHLAARGWNDTTLHYDHLHVDSKNGNDATGGQLKLDGIEIGASDGAEDVISLSDDSSCDTATDGNVGTAAVSSIGEGDDYPYRLPGDVSWKAGSKDPGADPWSFYKRECVSFVAWRLNQQMGTPKAPYAFTKTTMNFGRGNAMYWRQTLTAKGYKADMTPAVGAVAWWNAGGTTKYPVGDKGHVAIVKEIKPDGRVVFEQYNGGTGPNKLVHASYTTFEADADIVNAYIHVADVMTSGTPDNKEEEE